MVLVMTVLCGAAFAQTPQVVSTVPAQNELDVAVDGNISVTFDIDMDPGSINDSSFMVLGMCSGMIDGTITYDVPSKTATFDPVTDCAGGDIFTVVLNQEICSILGVQMTQPYVWTFTTEVGVSQARFALYGSYGTAGAGRVFSSDFDGDGDMDLAINNVSADSVSIHMNNGDGTFAAPTGYSTGDTPYGLFAGDYDNDGDMDLAISSIDDWSVSVHMNNGDGTFAPRDVYVLDYSAFPDGIFAGDLNGDGYLDLITPNLNDDNVSVLLNDGDGTFAPRVNYGVGDRPREGFASDLDNDGDIDLAVTNSWEPYVSILLNNGDGTFAPDVMYAVASNPGKIFSSDLDADGDNDLAVITPATDTICVLLNNGDGTFGTYSGYAVGDEPYAVFADDFDGDGDIDLTVSNLSSDNISVLLNNGDGTFAPQYTHPAGAAPANLFASDLDGDGDLDLAVCNAGYDTVLIMLNFVCEYVNGDVNGSGSYNGLDITYGVGFFKGGNAPLCDPCLLCLGWWHCGDVNGSCSYNGLDITYGVAYFKGGALPVPCADCPPFGGAIASYREGVIDPGISGQSAIEKVKSYNR